MERSDAPSSGLQMGRAEVSHGGLDYMTFDDRDRPYSQVVRVGNLIYTAGASVGEPGDDIGTQTAKTLEYLRDLLQKVGTDFSHVVRVGVFLTDIGEWGAMNEVYVTYFAEGRRPARSAMGASGLALGARVEIECIAAE